jgi:general secretion pathway protein J
MRDGIMRRRAGFTLLEVMISVAILGVIMTLVWSSTSQTMKAADRTQNRDLVFHMGRVALRKLSEDVNVAFLAKYLKKNVGTGQMEPEQTQIKTFFIGEDQGAQDSLGFTALSHLRLFSGAKECDQTKIRYEVVASEEEAGVYNLIRKEDAWLDGTTDMKGKPLILVEDIKEFNLEYYDPRKREWVKEWNSDMVDWKDRLPFAVRINISFADPDDEETEIPMSTSVLLALSAGPIEM